MVIGITGGVGAGKTLVLTYLKEKHGALVLLADEIARELLEPEGKAGRKIRELFPGDLFEEDGSIRRTAMAEYIFQNPQMRQKQNDIVFPLVKQKILEIIRQNRDRSLIVVEAALLIEEHYDEICDVMWYIYSSEQKRTQRLVRDRGYSLQRIRDMMDSQLSEQEFRAGCDAVLENDGTPEETYERIEALLTRYGFTKSCERAVRIEDTVRRV